MPKTKIFGLCQLKITTHTWKSILNSRNKGINLLDRKFKDGKKTSLWFDPWINGKSLISLLGWTNLIYFGGANLKVDSIIENHKWNPNNHPAASIFKNAIEKIEIDPNSATDCWKWKLSKREKFSFKATWDYLKGFETNMEWCSVIWNKANCPKMAHCAYFALLNRLPTRDRCKKWSKNNFFDTKCLLCNMESESADHLFFDCIFSRHIWFIAKNKLFFSQNKPMQSIKDSIQYIQESFNFKSEKFNKASIMLTTAIYHIWKERNARQHSNKKTDAIKIWKNIEIDFHILSQKASKNKSQFYQLLEEHNDQDEVAASMELYLQRGKTNNEFPQSCFPQFDKFRIHGTQRREASIASTSTTGGGHYSPNTKSCSCKGSIQGHYFNNCAIKDNRKYLTNNFLPDISRNYRTSREVATKLDPLLHQNTSINTDQFLHRTEEQSYISKLNGNTYHISVWERGESSRNDIINDKSKLFYKVDCRNGPIKLISYNIGNLTQEKDGSTNYNFKADAKYSESISKKKSRIWNPP
jgi:hypothetical protein